MDHGEGLLPPQIRRLVFRQALAQRQRTLETSQRRPAVAQPDPGFADPAVAHRNVVLAFRVGRRGLQQVLPDREGLPVQLQRVAHVAATGQNVGDFVQAHRQLALNTRLVRQRCSQTACEGQVGAVLGQCGSALAERQQHIAEP